MRPCDKPIITLPQHHKPSVTTYSNHCTTMIQHILITCDPVMDSQPIEFNSISIQRSCDVVSFNISWHHGRQHQLPQLTIDRVTLLTKGVLLQHCNSKMLTLQNQRSHEKSLNLTPMHPTSQNLARTTHVDQSMEEDP